MADEFVMQTLALNLEFKDTLYSPEQGKRVKLICGRLTGTEETERVLLISVI